MLYFRCLPSLLFSQFLGSAVLCLTLIWRKLSCHFSYLLCFFLSAHVGPYAMRVTPSSTALGPSILGSSRLVSACFPGSEASAGDSSGADFLPPPCPSKGILHSCHSVSGLRSCFWSLSRDFHLFAYAVHLFLPAVCFTWGSPSMRIRVVLCS